MRWNNIVVLHINWRNSVNIIACEINCEMTYINDFFISFQRWQQQGIVKS